MYYGSLESNPHPGTEQLKYITNYDLDPGHTFLEMLTNLIHFQGDGSNYMRTLKSAQEAKVINDDELILRNAAEPETYVLFFPGIFVEIHEVDADIVFSVEVTKQPVNAASINSRRRADYKIHYHYPGTFGKGPFGEWQPGPRPKPESDLERTYRISENTLYRLGELLKPAIG
jgi:hypothetical protein